MLRAATAEPIVTAAHQEARPVLEELAARSRQPYAAASTPAELRAIWITATGAVVLGMLSAAGGYLYALQEHHGTLAWAESQQGREAHALAIVNAPLGGLPPHRLRSTTLAVGSRAAGGSGTAGYTSRPEGG